jgi:hypothetical protein
VHRARFELATFDWRPENSDHKNDGVIDIVDDF